VFTNTGPAVAFRAPGYVEGAFALESAMDELARALDIDPIELRLRNYVDRDQVSNRRYTSPQGLRHCYDQAAEAFGWVGRGRRSPARQATGPHADGAPTGRRRRGVGVAAHDWGGGGFDPAYAWVKLNGDGSVDVVTGTQDIGTGARTGLAQIAAEELGLPLERISLHLGDTASGPYAPTSAGSATQASVGPAIRMAAANARRELLGAAAAFLEVPADRLRLRGGRIEAEGRPERSATIEEITQRLSPYMIQGRGHRTPNPPDRSIRTFGVHCVEVEVDLDTGELDVVRLVASHDCGRIVNPKMVDSQVIGGAVQGIGFATTEERVVDHASGIVLNANLEEYKVPTIADIGELVHAQLNEPDPEANSTGAKGIGEPPLIPTAPAIANAFFDATGVRIRELPLTRDRVLAALERGLSGAPASGPGGGET
jgi:xanthine dehydrogenase YagR molybdenum-binding subunit